MEIPVKERKKKFIAFKCTEKEREIVTRFCDEKHISKSELMRFLLKKAIPEFNSISI